jgi:hypothetical protein
MPTINPFADDSVKASVFEEGFIDGFMEPDASGFRPLASDSCSSAKQTRCVVLAALSAPGPARSGLTPDQSMPHRGPARPGISRARRVRPAAIVRQYQLVRSGGRKVVAWNAGTVLTGAAVRRRQTIGNLRGC